MFKKPPHPHVELLRSVALFEGVPDDVLQRLCDHLEEVDVPEGRRITTEGSQAFEAFIIAEGTAQIRVDGEVVGEAGTGELLGEVAVMQGRPRTATTSALTPMRLLAVKAGEIDWLFSDESLSERVRENLGRHLGGPQSHR